MCVCEPSIQICVLCWQVGGSVCFLFNGDCAGGREPSFNMLFWKMFSFTLEIVDPLTTEFLWYIGIPAGEIGISRGVTLNSKGILSWFCQPPPLHFLYFLKSVIFTSKYRQRFNIKFLKCVYFCIFNLIQVFKILFPKCENRDSKMAGNLLTVRQQQSYIESVTFPL